MSISSTVQDVSMDTAALELGKEVEITRVCENITLYLSILIT